MPPLCSMVRMARVHRRRRTAEPSASDSSEVSCRLGRKRRRVLLLAWLTLLPASTPLPVISQRRDMSGTSGCRKARVMANGAGGVKQRRWAAAILTLDAPVRFGAKQARFHAENNGVDA